MNAYYTAADHFALLPAILLALFGCTALGGDFLLPGPRWRLVIALLGEAFTAAALTRQQWAVNSQGTLISFHGAFVVDSPALLFQWVCWAAAVLTIFASYRYLQIANEEQAEYYGLLLLAQCGMTFLTGGNELVTLFVGLELMSVSFYILVGFLRREQRTNEAALKYLLLGGLSSGFLAYGFSLLYGLAGSTLLHDIGTAVTGRALSDPLLLLAIGTTLVGLLFKVAAVPFHMWAPDAYEGAPTPITAYLSVASTTASLALLLRLLAGPLSGVRILWEPLLIGVAVASLTLGNFAAVGQNSVKRLLAYSSVAHVGYLLLGIIAGNATGLQGIAIYLVTYALMTLGAFLLITALRQETHEQEDIAALQGLWHRHPWWAIAMLTFLLSLAGLPPTAGFFGKYYLFKALVETSHPVLATIGALYVGIALYYYFRIVRVMFLNTDVEPVRLRASGGLRLALVVTSALTLLFGIYPEPILRWAEAGERLLTR